MKTPHTLFGLALMALPLTPLHAQTPDQFSCAVEDFIGFSDDAAFKAKNKRKRFTLRITGTEVIAFVKSKDFRDHENRYEIIQRKMLDTVAINAGRGSLGTLVIPADPRRTLARKGYFNASVSTQSNHFVNSWLLRCTK
ncbi:hypothetical protein [Rhodalgimonas zhirmunskyi]|uniref:Uncharacterized protein n=1 Tax=Rhodalgimonas zhirmunskyi TaxID=2964767 RepID=A0AAJ1X4T4_9RHOB|nr:hypothetical protein [Rhodoalgimonas zhirmunskyi]MDQ2093439.1 hypothetical protein [Rhodoalgimonas zhirmunskyi]